MRRLDWKSVTLTSSTCPHACPHCDRAPLIRDLLIDIKRLWDAEGFGADEAISEPLYARLSHAITQMDRSLTTER